MNQKLKSILMIVMAFFSIPMFAGDLAIDGSHGRHHGVGRPAGVEVHGTITAVSAGSISIQASNGSQVLVSVNSDTVIRQGDTSLTPADLAVGDEVRVDIAPQPDGTLLALEIHVSHEGEGGQASIMGLVTAVASDQLTVLTPAGLDTVEVNASTLVMRGDATVDFSTIVVGDFIEAEGTTVDETTILASRIHVEVENAEPAEISGTVASIGDSSLVVHTDGGDINVTVSPDTVILRHHQPILLTDIAVGDQVEVTGVSTDATDINASKINDETGSEPAETHGTVTAVGTDSIVVNTAAGSITVTVTATTQIFKHGRTIAITDILVGDQVEIHGTSVDATHIAASRINDESENETEPVELSGVVSSVGATQIVIAVDGNSVTVTVTATTQLRSHGQTILITDIHAGDRVEVHGTSTDATDVTASRIDDEAEHETEPVEFSGVVASIGADQLVVTTEHNSVTVTVTSATIIRRSGHTIALADIHVGDRVEVHGTPTDSTDVTATRIDDEAEPAEAELSGMVTSIGDGSLMVGTTTVVVNDSTSITRDHHTISFADIAVGDQVEVHGTRTDATDVTATSIDVQSSDGGHDH